ncbi:MAG: homoserine O-succinyltransferase [Firmicutes bacterium]|nr:homoserine O-succinyltransferase [Bacillota bacterium]MCL2770867.1 homoserine O-succinyltransferase [Bacillota bacterium]
MPIIIPADIPAFKTLQKENVFVMTNERAIGQDIRPIEIAILNLMPTKVETETQLLRLLSNTPLQVNITLIKTSTYKSQNTSEEHLSKFYVEFKDIKEKKFDGAIITGAPVEKLCFSEVKYWNELTDIMDWAKTNVTSTMFICWGAQGGLFHYYGIDKVLLKEKLSGVFIHKREVEAEPLLKGIDDVVYIPHSRYTGLDEKAIRNCSELEVLIYGKRTKSSIIKSKCGSQFFLTGHSEYDDGTLDSEYQRDLGKGLEIKQPCNYYNSQKEIVNRWKSTANLIFSNWLNYYVYQITPYKL